ncbi:hypothetical protein [Novosphingobium sp.]|uniref:hypothetical protein n=1 Tax=Novosphingobium sp. TaxID=1874826 RepID=UPI0038B946F7
MDFMKLLKSLEELLYEIMVMLVFFPRTLWLTFRFPQRMMDYADTELGDVQSEQYDDTLSPPLFLMICVAVSHFIGKVAYQQQTVGLPSTLNNTENLLIFRVIVFSLFPLIFSLRLLHRLKIPLDRTSLRPPFFSQCFIAAPTAMLFGVCQALPHLLGTSDAVGRLPPFSILMFWYIRQQSRWFENKLAITRIAAWRMAISTTLLAFIAMLVASGIVIYSQKYQTF